MVLITFIFIPLILYPSFISFTISCNAFAVDACSTRSSAQRRYLIDNSLNFQWDRGSDRGSRTLIERFKSSYNLAVHPIHRQCWSKSTLKERYGPQIFGHKYDLWPSRDRQTRTKLSDFLARCFSTIDRSEKTWSVHPIPMLNPPCASHIYLTVSFITFSIKKLFYHKICRYREFWFLDN